MDPVIVGIVAVAVVGLVAILAAVAIYRGWFRLVSIAHEDKVQFILMQKKVVVLEDPRKVPVPVDGPVIKDNLTTDGHG